MKFSILLVDDEIFYREIMAMSLEARGFNVSHAGNGVEAIDFLQDQNNKIDLILLDMMMPLMNGFEVLTKITEINKYKTIPVIFQTGADFNNDYNKIIGSNNIYFIQKPYEIDDLIKIINKILI